VREFGAAWRAPSPDGAPKSPWRLLKLGALGGLALYALGDLVFSGVHALAGGAEPAPAMLVRMLSAPSDLVLANFLLVGFLEEFVFRRGLFKPLWTRLEKRGLTKKRAFWAAAVLSALIFSGAHYVDYNGLMAHFGIGGGAAAAAAPGLSGAYAFSWGGFVSRAVLGVALAWLYAASGTLLLPIVAHFLADSLEGLGLHFGLLPFLAMGAAILLAQRVWKRGATQRP
jgi:membrane protease YdiL (CAAX protease family)